MTEYKEAMYQRDLKIASKLEIKLARFFQILAFLNTPQQDEVADDDFIPAPLYLHQAKMFIDFIVSRI